MHVVYSYVYRVVKVEKSPQSVCDNRRVTIAKMKTLNTSVAYQDFKYNIVISTIVTRLLGINFVNVVFTYQDKISI